MKKLKSFPTKMKRTHHISTASALFVNLRSRGFFIFVVTAFGYPKRQKIENFVDNRLSHYGFDSP